MTNEQPYNHSLCFLDGLCISNDALFILDSISLHLKQWRMHLLVKWFLVPKHFSFEYYRLACIAIYRKKKATLKELADHQLFYLDFAGKSAYIVQLFRYENYFVGHKVGNFRLISFLLELHQLRKSVLNLYAWREFAMELSNQITLSHIKQSYKYDLVEVSDYASNNFVQSPKRNVTPVNIFLSPSNQSKRTKHMTDQS